MSCWSTISSSSPEKSEPRRIFHTFNALYEAAETDCHFSDCLPKDINSIEERLALAVEWGLIADIQPPDLETKIAILQKKAENDRFSLPDDVARYIARAIKSNVPRARRCFDAAMAYASLTGATFRWRPRSRFAQHHCFAGKARHHRPDPETCQRALQSAGTGLEGSQ